ncbi:helix-turn-helix domain-containing protein [Streptomyces caniferus]|uniref:winged helix-turn-helix transcriptional regulator n=1 Tax=Streptomyces caniferus TaxID=285557 RepID=UPI0034538A2E
MRRERERVDEMAAWCDTEVVLSVVGGKWKLLILRYLLLGTHRFGELKQALSTVTQRMLTGQLRELEEDGLVSRTVYAEVPPKVEYSLTEVGESLRGIIDQLETWGSWYREQLKNQAGDGQAHEHQAGENQTARDGCASVSAPLIETPRPND